MAIDWDDLVIGPTVEIFGELVTYTPTGSAPFQITAVFDEEYEGVSPLAIGIGQVGQPADDTDRRPILGVQLSQFPAGVTPQQDDALKVLSNGVAYLVKEVRPDGHGHAKLLLNEA